MKFIALAAAILAAPAFAGAQAPTTPAPAPTPATAPEVSLDHGPGFIDGEHSPVQFGTA